jgi:2-C-methyl-D-erythritol 4-phosphate cytidylyltransferase
MWQALTPQGAPRATMEAALAQAQAPVTDEASALETHGCAPRLVEGDPANIKITGPADLAFAEAILEGRRSGAGVPPP